MYQIILSILLVLSLVGCGGDYNKTCVKEITGGTEIIINKSNAIKICTGSQDAVSVRLEEATIIYKIGSYCAKEAIELKEDLTNCQLYVKTKLLSLVP